MCSVYLGESVSHWEELFRYFEAFISTFKTAHKEVEAERTRQAEAKRRRERTAGLGKQQQQQQHPLGQTPTAAPASERKRVALGTLSEV